MRHSTNPFLRSSRFLVTFALLAGVAGAQLAPAVAGLPSTVSLASSPNPATYGAMVTLTATISPPTIGTVTFYDGFTVLGSSPVSGGQALLTTSLLKPGTHSLK